MSFSWLEDIRIVLTTSFCCTLVSSREVKLQSNGGETMSMMDLPSPLKPAETLELFRKKEAGDAYVREQIVEGNLRLVMYVARKYENTGLSLEDLFSIGLIGIMKAVDSFKLEKEYKFATYASRCIDNEILMFLRRQKKINEEIGIDSPITTDVDGNELTLMDVTPDLKVKPFDEIFEWNNTMEEIEEAMKILKPREQSVLHMRFFQNMKQKEVAVALNISRTYISRIEKKILKKLRKQMLANEKQKERKEKEMAQGVAHPKKDEAIRMLKETEMTYGEIEKATGIPYGTIANYAQAHRPKEVRKRLAAKTQTPKPGMVREHTGDTDKAVQMLAERGKYTYNDIWKMTGVPQGSLTRLRRQYEAGEYKWVNEPKKRVEIQVPVEPPVIELEALMGEKDLAKAKERLTIPEAINEFKREIRAELYEEVRAQVLQEMAENSKAEQTSPMGTIQKLVTFKYHITGGNVPTQDFIHELAELIEMLHESNNPSVTFTINVEAE